MNKLGIIALLLIVVFGMFLRIFKLSAQSLWWDEGYTYLLVEDIRREGPLQCITNPAAMTQYSNTEKGQPLFSVLSSFFPSGAGPEVNIRAVSVAASILAILAFWWFFRVQGLDKTGYAMGLAFVALSPFLVFYAQEGRPYALVLLWLLLFLAVVERDREILSSNGLVAVGILALLIGLTHFMALFPVAAVLLWKFWTSRKEKAVLHRWLLAGVLVAIASVPAFYLAGIHRVQTPPSEISIHSYLYAMYTFIVGFSLGPSTYELHLDSSLSALKGYLGAVFAVGVVGGATVITGVIEAIRRRRFFIVVVPLLTLIFVILFTLATRLPLKNPRHFISIFPFFVVLLALGISSVKSNMVRYLLLVTLFLLMLLSLYNYYFSDRYHKEDNRGAAGFVQTYAREEERVLVAAQAAFSVYYRGTAEVLPLTVGDKEFLQFIKQSNHRGIWVVLSRPWSFDPKGEKERFLRANGELTEFHGVRVFHVQPAPKEDMRE